MHHFQFSYKQLKTFPTELCIHHSCHTRLLFVKMCGMALDIFSSSYIKEHFFLRLLSLAGKLGY